jgi:hypothetical protein
VTILCPGDGTQIKSNEKISKKAKKLLKSILKFATSNFIKEKKKS